MAEKGKSSGGVDSMTSTSSMPSSSTCVSQVIERPQLPNYSTSISRQNPTTSSIDVASLSQTRPLMSKPTISNSKPLSPRPLSKELPTMVPAPVSEPYHTLEKAMERRAIELGGMDLRRKFFQSLQESRSRMRREHSAYSNNVRAYLADLDV